MLSDCSKGALGLLWSATVSGLLPPQYIPVPFGESSKVRSSAKSDAGGLEESNSGLLEEDGIHAYMITCIHACIYIYVTHNTHAHAHARTHTHAIRTYVVTYIRTYIRQDRKTSSQANRETDRQLDRQTDRKTERQTGRHTDRLFGACLSART